MKPTELIGHSLNEILESILSTLFISLYSNRESLFVYDHEQNLEVLPLLTFLNPILEIDHSEQESKCVSKVRVRRSVADTYEIKIDERYNGVSVIYFLILYVLFNPGRHRFIVSGILIGHNDGFSIYALQKIFLPLFEPLLDIRINVTKINFRSNSKCSLIIERKKSNISEKDFLSGIADAALEVAPPFLPFDEIKEVESLSVASENLKPRHVAQRQITGVRQAFEAKVSLGKPQKLYIESIEPGSELTLWLKSRVLINHLPIFTNCMGEKGVPAESIGMQCGKNLLEIIDNKYRINPTYLYYYLPLIILFGGNQPFHSDNPNNSLVNLYKMHFSDRLEIAEDLISCQNRPLK